MKTLNELKNGCGKVLSISIDSDNSKEITCDGKILCETCQALIQQQEEILNIVEERFNKVDLSGISDTQAYKLAGNGQSVNVVEKILVNMLSRELKDGK